ncbi:MAG: Mu-like prophage major head subunit gpT family protein, partial [Sediminibacterium sp.]
IKAWWGQVYDEHKEEYSQLFDSDTSSMNYEEDVQLTGFGLAPVKSEGSGVAYDSEIQGFTTRYTHIAYALGYIVTKEELDDNLYEQVSRRRAAALAMSFRQTKENVGANIYNRAFNGTYLGGDGVALCSTAHPNTSGGTFANTPTVAADLSEASLEDALTAIMGFQNDRGLLINVMPRSLVVARQNWWNANRIMKSAYTPSTANNAVNVLVATNALPEGIVMNHYLTSPNAWFVRTNIQNGLKYYSRVGIQFDQDNDFDTMNAKAKGYERYSFGWTDPRAIYGVNGP